MCPRLRAPAHADGLVSQHAQGPSRGSGPSPGYDDYYGGGGGGGESVITLEEFTDLKRAIQTLVEAQASQRRGSRFKIDCRSVVRLAK